WDMLVVGLMSGTSADAIDVALVEWPEGAEAKPFSLVAFRERPHSKGLQQDIHRLAAGELAAGEMLKELVRLDRLLADRFADAVLSVLDEAGVGLKEIDGIASHGQTVAHHPELGGSLQIGCPVRLAERLKRPVIADFRRRDLAMDGEGAPLAPFFHHALFADQNETRGVLNLGGIANLTWLPAGGGPDAVTAFDVGPANALLDGVISLATEGRESFDRDGRLARSGTPVSVWLQEMLADPYLRREPPKSTGRERYGLAEARQWLARAERERVDLADLMATLAEAVTTGVAMACRKIAGAAALESGARLYVAGGGVRNGHVMDLLQTSLAGVTVESVAAAGVPAEAVEAMAFSLMGRNALRGLPNQLPQCTGVAKASVLGVIHGREWGAGIR
ncbi:MAG: anhydro-N-acetylmuramic acid kinase, partial [Myxococcota bacterium]